MVVKTPPPAPTVVCAPPTAASPDAPLTLSAGGTVRQAHLPVGGLLCSVIPARGPAVLPAGPSFLPLLPSQGSVPVPYVPPLSLTRVGLHESPVCLTHLSFLFLEDPGRPGGSETGLEKQAVRQGPGAGSHLAGKKDAS